MTPQELQALRDYLAKPDAISYTHNGDTRTLAEWIAVRDDAAVAGCLSSIDVGLALGKTVVRDLVPATEVKAAIAASAEFATMPESVMSKLQWFISADPFPMGEPAMASGVDRILEPFAGARSSFNALRVRVGSIAESLIGRSVSTNEISDALNV